MGRSQKGPAAMQGVTTASHVEAEVSTGGAAGSGDWIPRVCLSEPVSLPHPRGDTPGNYIPVIGQETVWFSFPRTGMYVTPATIGLETVSVFFSVVVGVERCVCGRLVPTAHGGWE